MILYTILNSLIFLSRMSENYFDEDIYYESNNDGFQHSVAEEKHSPLPPNYKLEQDLQAADSAVKSATGHKNKYVNRIKNFINQSGAGEDSAANPSGYGDSSMKSMDKKERNKQAAKNSRDRKKLYIQIMEQKKKALKKQLESKKRELEENKNYYERIVSQSKTMSNFAASRHQLIKRLEVLLTNPEGDPTEQINSLIDNLRSRIGATGKERINTINEYFRQIVNLSLPALHRYMMWSAAQGKHLFSSTEEKQAQKEQWFRQLKSSLNLTEEQKIEIKNKQNFLRDQKVILEGLINELKEVKDQIQNKSLELDDIIDGIRKILTPIQCAHFILFIEKNKYRKQLNLCDPINEEEFPKRKIVKKQEQR